MHPDPGAPVDPGTPATASPGTAPALGATLAHAARALTLADEPAAFTAVLEGEDRPPPATALDEAALRG